MDSKYNIKTTQNVNIELKIAGIGDRFIALMIDYFIFISIAILLFIIYSNEIVNNKDIVYIFYVVLAFMGFLYYFILEWIFKGQSFGKKFRKIRVVKESGMEAGTLQYLIRNLIRPIDSFYGLGLVVIFFSSKFQRIGDFASGTIVIKLEKETSVEDTIYQEPDDNYQPIFSKLEVHNIGVQEIELIKELLKKPNDQINWDYIKLLADSIKKKTGIITKDMNNLEFLKALMKEFQYYNS